ncbi:RmlC-like cupin domain superfamily [Arabidopsis suecica]|uniref:RmlC-like cupin domain superfamily n=1 Tax=Arabidopsis suecica TaxID=45249 RepID=A0A8T2F2X4_ARASU|nr:RmlC-like cupin domain superfamily [Arabidopsis suecica]
MKYPFQCFLAKIILLALASSFVSCYDPSPLQDYCVAVPEKNGVFVNGEFCKDPKLVTSDDFFASGLNIPGNTNNRLGSFVNPANIPGLNTLGVGIARIDFAPGGQIPPHIHPRASEIILVIKGKLLVGFVSSNDYNYTLFSKILYPGDVFVHPIGLVQFHANIGKTNAVAIGAVGSQNPGYISVGDAVFGSKPPIDPKILAKAFALDINIVRYLRKVFSPQDDIVND